MTDSVLYIIGNGFDLFHGVKSSYGSFRKWLQIYRVVSQSGPMKIAFRYNLPDIVSNLPGLMCELKENINGFSFKSEDVNSLADVMENCVNMSDDDYNDLLQRMKNYTDKNYSFDVIVNKYCDMFEKVIINRK